MPERCKTIFCPVCRGLYHCNYCQKDITSVVRIKCAVCQDFDLCLDCFSVGVQITPHRNDHAYRVMDSLSFPLYHPDWGVRYFCIFFSCFFAYASPRLQLYPSYFNSKTSLIMHISALLWQRRQRRHMIQACLIDCLQHSMLCQLSPQAVLHILRVQHICLCLFLLGAPAQWHNVAQHSMARHSFVQKQQNLGTVQASVSALANPKTTIFMQKTAFYSANPNPETSGDSTHVFLHWGHVFSN